MKYSYDPVGQVMTVQHPNGRETNYAYDLLGRKLMVNHPDAGETNMTYDAAGNLLTKLTAELRKSISDKGYISYTYDFERLHEVLILKISSTVLLIPMVRLVMVIFQTTLRKRKLSSITVII